MTVAAGRREPTEAPDWCFDMNDQGTMSTCTWTGREWVKSYDDGPGMGGDMGPPAGFGVLMFLVVLAGLGMMVWRVSLARRVARDAGLDPDRATEITLLEDHGLEASYLASHLQQRPVSGQPSPPAVRGAEERLRELRSLLDQGLVTQEEYEARRRAVVDSL
jgi:hypothetical protein